MLIGKEIPSVQRCSAVVVVVVVVVVIHDFYAQKSNIFLRLRASDFIPRVKYSS